MAPQPLPMPPETTFLSAMPVPLEVNAPTVASDRRTPLPERILVATDGSTMADGAFRAAGLLAERTGAPVDVVTVLPPVAPLASELGFVCGLPCGPIEQDRKDALMSAVRRQAERANPEAVRWRIDVTIGQPATVIARAAHGRGVGLIVQGMGPHRCVDRNLGREIVLQLARLTDAAVLAVTPHFWALPRRAVVAVDFSRASIEAARHALQVVRSPARVILAHVDPGAEARREAAKFEDTIYRQGVEHLFARLLRELAPSAGVTLETVTLRGERVRELLALADRERVDLIAVGNHRHTFFESVLIGSVVMKIVRSASCSVLITPSKTADGLGATEAETC